MKEIWKPVEGYEGLYEISNLGRVKSLSRQKQLNKYVKTIDERIMKQSLNKRGYMYVRLTKNGVQRAYRVHRLVAAAFVENPDNLPHVNHIDFNRTNNRADNLEWITPKCNSEHSKQNMKKRHNVKTNTGERYVRYIEKRNAYCVTVNRHKTFSYRTLEEAIKKRDELLGVG